MNNHFFTVRRVLLALMAVWLISPLLPCAFAQDYWYVEYFFDTDPGYYNGNLISYYYSSQSTMTFDINTTSLTPGTHRLYVRVRDPNNLWSLPYCKLIHVFTEPIPVTPYISHFEYFIDTDPGIGNGTGMDVSLGEQQTWYPTIDVSSLSVGAHRVYFRAQDHLGKWSIPYVKSIHVFTEPVASNPNVEEFEYFFDTDPGCGRGTVTMYGGTTPTLERTFVVDMTALSVGAHRLYMRSRDSNGRWSLPYAKLLHVFNDVIPASTPDIAALEYFVDNDPGRGLGTVVDVSAGNSYAGSLAVNLTGMTPGSHRVYFRTRDSNGKWSLPFCKTVHLIADVPVASIPNITALEYYVDNDPGFGSGIAIPVTASQQVSVEYTADLSSLSAGEHRLYVRARDANGRWSIVYTDTVEMAGNHPPTVVRPISDLTLPYNTGTAWVLLDTVFTDADLASGDSLRYAISIDGQSATGTIYGNMLRIDSYPSRSGVTAMIALAVDDSGAVARDTFYVDVLVSPDPPRAPATISIARSGEDVRLNWSRVSLTVAGSPITVQRYLVFFKNTYSSPYWNFLGATYHADSLTYWHRSVILHSASMFYIVRAWTGSAAAFDQIEQEVRSEYADRFIPADAILSRLNRLKSNRDSVLPLPK